MPLPELGDILFLALEFTDCTPRSWLGAFPPASSCAHVYELLHRCRVQAVAVQTQFEYRLLLLGRVAACKIRLELFEQQWNAVVSSACVSQGKFYLRLRTAGAVLEEDGNGI